MQSNGLISNFIDYTGKVTFKLKRGNKVYPLTTHNTGTQLLMDTLAKFMAGYWNEVKDNVPKYLDFGYLDDKGKFNTVLYQEIPFVGIVSSSNPDAVGSVVTLNATIPCTAVREITNEPDKWRLCTKTSSGEILATIDEFSLLDGLYDSLISSADAIIEWKLVFSNSIAGGTE